MMMLRRVYSSFYERSKGIMNQVDNRLIPQLRVLIQTTRHKVEQVKRETEQLETQFKAARNSLAAANKVLEGTKTELQCLYTRRDLEYRKSKSDVRVIREINEEENKLREREEMEQQRVDECRQKELELFNMTQSLNQLLYETTQNYAKRYIVLGISVGTVFSLWKVYQYSRNKPEAPLSDIVEETKLLNTDIASALNGLKMEHNKMDLTNAKLDTVIEDIKAIEKALHAKGVDQHNMSDDEEASSLSLSSTIAIGLSAGFIGGTLPLLLNFVYVYWLS